MEQFAGQMIYYLYIFILLILSGCSSSIPQIPVKGEFMRRTVETTVDSEIAKYYLENYLQHQRIDSIIDKRIDTVYVQYPHSLSRVDLKNISESYSVDFATLFFAERLRDEEANRNIQTFFE